MTNKELPSVNHLRDCALDLRNGSSVREDTRKRHEEAAADVIDDIADVMTQVELVRLPSFAKMRRYASDLRRVAVDLRRTGDKCDKDAEAIERSADFVDAAGEFAKPSTAQPPVQVALGCISPEARGLLDVIQHEYTAHRDDMERIFPSNDFLKPEEIYQVMYWLVRWSGLVQPTDKALQIAAKFKENVNG